MDLGLFKIKGTKYKYKENIKNWSAGHKRILSSFTGHKKRKAWNKTREKYMPEERRQSLAETDK